MSRKSTLHHVVLMLLSGLAAVLATNVEHSFAFGWETRFSGSHRTFNENISNLFRPGRTEDENLLSFRFSCGYKDSLVAV